MEVSSVKVRWRGNRGGRWGVIHVISGDGQKTGTYRSNGYIGGPINTPETSVDYQVNDTFTYPVQFEVGESLDRFNEESYCTNGNTFIVFKGLKPPA